MFIIMVAYKLNKCNLTYFVIYDHIVLYTITQQITQQICRDSKLSIIANEADLQLTSRLFAS